MECPNFHVPTQKLSFYGLCGRSFQTQDFDYYIYFTDINFSRLPHVPYRKGYTTF